MKFKKDDNVKIVKSDELTEIGKSCVIVGITFSEDYPYWVEFENGSTIGFAEDELEKIYKCPNCAGNLIEEIEPDEKPDGTILGYKIYICEDCENEYAPDDIEKE